MADADLIAAEMEDVLLLERQHLEAGNAREAGLLAERKLSALSAFQGLLETGELRAAPRQAREQAERIIALARENAVLLEAVRNGLQSLIGRIGQAGSSYVGSYGQGGGQLAFPQARGAYMKRV